MQKNQILATPGQKIIMNTVQKELFPALESLKELLVKIQKLRVTFSLYSRELSLIEKEYEKTTTDFFETTRKLQTPDILFKDSKLDQNIVDYFQFRGAFIQNITEGASYIEIIDRTLDRKRGTIQNSRTLCVALVALVVSIVIPL